MMTMIKIYYSFLCILACHPTLYDSACGVFISLAHSATPPHCGSMITMCKIDYSFLCILACHPTLYDSACIVFISLAHSTTLPILGI